MLLGQPTVLKRLNAKATECRIGQQELRGLSELRAHTDQLVYALALKLWVRSQMGFAWLLPVRIRP